MKAPQIVIGIAAALVLAGGGFAAGMTFDKAQTPATSTGATGASGARGGTGARGGFGGGGPGAVAGQQPVTGRIIAVNDGSITIAAVDRGQGQNAPTSASPATTSEIVLVGTSTRIVKTTETDVKLSDLKVNDQVTVVGTTDTTGMVSATTILVGVTNVIGQLFGGGGGARPTASPTKAP